MSNECRDLTVTRRRCCCLPARSLASAADVTFERLRNPEPQNWLMNHRDYRLAALLAARRSSTSQRQEPQARLRGPARRHLRQRIHRGDAAGRGRLHVHHRRAGAWSTRSMPAPAPAAPIVWKMDPGPGKARPQPRRGAVGQPRHLGHRLRRPRHRDRQGDRQDRLGQEPARPARPGAHRGAARAQGLRHRSAPPAATTACATGSRRSIPRPATCSGRPSRSRRPASPAARPGRTRPTPGRPAAARSTSPAPTIRPPT